MEIPKITNSRYFGAVGKAVWYEVSDNYNPYLIDLEVDLLPNERVRLIILNRFSVPSNPEYIRLFTSTQATKIYTLLQLYHIPNYKSPLYAVLNQPI